MVLVRGGATLISSTETKLLAKIADHINDINFDKFILVFDSRVVLVFIIFTSSKTNDWV